MEKFTITVKTQFGLEQILTEELKLIGVSEIELLNRAVRFTGDQALLYKCNLHLRTALKVLKPIATFDVHSEKQLYDMVQEIDWSGYLNVRQTFAINSSTNSERFSHSKYMALKTKDAIVDQFRDRLGERPSIDTRDPDLWIDLHISDRTCTLSLNSSGAPLTKRGYRLSRTLAPINEGLAAGIILLSGWDKETAFIDPMCGSGTFPIEAALIAGNIAPGSFRQFGFQKWNDYDRLLWKNIKEEAENKWQPIIAKIYAKDIDRKALAAAKENAERAGVESAIIFEKENFLESEATFENGILFMNPPYDERMQQEKVIEMYREIGTRMKHHYENWEAWIISGNIPALKRVGLRPSKKISLFNGALDCRLYKFEMYKGSKKNKLRIEN